MDIPPPPPRVPPPIPSVSNPLSCTNPFDQRKVQQALGGKPFRKLQPHLAQYKKELGVSKKLLAARSIECVEEPTEFDQDFVLGFAEQFSTAYDRIQVDGSNKLPLYLQPFAKAEQSREIPTILIEIGPPEVEAGKFVVDLEGGPNYLIDPRFILTHFKIFSERKQALLIRNLVEVIHSPATTPHQKLIAYEAYLLYKQDNSPGLLDDAIDKIKKGTQLDDEIQKELYQDLIGSLPDKDLRELAPRIIDNLEAIGIHDSFPEIMKLNDVSPEKPAGGLMTQVAGSIPFRDDVELLGSQVRESLPFREDVSLLGSKLRSFWNGMAMNGIIGFFMPGALRIRACKNALSKNPEDEKAINLLSSKIIHYTHEEIAYLSYLDGAQKKKALAKIATSLNKNLKALEPEARGKILEKVVEAFYEETLKDLSGEDEPLQLNDWPEDKRNEFLELLAPALTKNAGLAKIIARQLTRPETTTQAKIAWDEPVRKAFLEKCGEVPILREALAEVLFEKDGKGHLIYYSTGRKEAFKHLMDTALPQEKQTLTERLAQEFLEADRDNRLTAGAGRDLAQAIRANGQVVNNLMLSLRAKLYGDGLSEANVNAKIEAIKRQYKLVLVAFSGSAETHATESEMEAPTPLEYDEEAMIGFEIQDGRAPATSGKSERAKRTGGDTYSRRLYNSTGSLPNPSLGGAGTVPGALGYTVENISDAALDRRGRQFQVMRFKALSASNRTALQSNNILSLLQGADALQEAIRLLNEKLQDLTNLNVDGFQLALFYADQAVDRLTASAADQESRNTVLDKLTQIQNALTKGTLSAQAKNDLSQKCSAIQWRIKSSNINPTKLSGVSHRPQ